jgi:hypothetical protein
MVKEIPGGALKSISKPCSLLLVVLTTLGVIKGRPIYGRMTIIIIIIIIIIIYCNWVVTLWQWLFYMYTKYEIG